MHHAACGQCMYSYDAANCDPTVRTPFRNILLVLHFFTVAWGPLEIAPSRLIEPPEPHV